MKLNYILVIIFLYTIKNNRNRAIDRKSQISRKKSLIVLLFHICSFVKIFNFPITLTLNTYKNHFDEN